MRVFDVKKQKKGFCGGSLVASKYVITACHCTYVYDKRGLGVIGKYGVDGYALGVSIGDHKQDDWNETGKEKRLKVKSIKRHPEYEKNQPVPSNNQLNNGYDIAILELYIDVDLKIYTPACLAKQTEGARFNGKRAVAYGWGETANPSPDQPTVNYPMEPYELEMRIDSSSCTDLAEAEKNNNAMIMMAQEPRMMCAGLDIDIDTVQGGICHVRIVKNIFLEVLDTVLNECLSALDYNIYFIQADSGGPFTYRQQNQQHILIGVASFARGYRVTRNPNFGNPYISGHQPPVFEDACGTASYFVRVALFRDWIDEQLTGATFCQNNGDADEKK